MIYFQMLTNIIIDILAVIGSSNVFYYGLKKIARKKQKPDPINLINGIVLPAVDDPGWIDRPEQNSTLFLGNTQVCYKECNWDSHYGIKCHNRFHAFIQQLDKHGNYNICVDDRAKRYFDEVLRYHMKYMIECPEIKQLQKTE
jgi:hypothetical protein